MSALRPYRRPLALVLLALLALGQGGCLGIIAGAAAGGVAAGYVFTQGTLGQTYPTTPDNARNAVHAALADLGMKITEEENSGGSAFVKSQTGNGETVRIHLVPQESKFPSDGALTRVTVRVGALGDQPASERILHQVETHLAPSPVPATPAAAPPAWTPVTPPPPTAPPPLAMPLTPTAAQPVSRTAR